MEDQAEKESFKVPKSIVLHLRGWGYTCFLNSFVLCACAGEISRPSASKVVQFFSGVNSEAEFAKKKIPFVQEVTYQAAPSKNGVLREIDLSSVQALKKLFGVKKLDMYPLLWGYLVPIQQMKTFTFKQTVACRYLVMKLIDSQKTNPNDSNIDVYNMSLNTVSLEF